MGPRVTQVGPTCERTAADRRLVLMAVMIGTFLAPLDSSIVNIALPSLSAELGVGLSAIGWVATAYLMTSASLVLTMGRVADIWGLRRTYVLGFAIFGLGSLACALSGTFALLIASRVLQALGASMMFACGPAIITMTFEPGERGWALGVVGLAVSAGLAAGPVLGGLLVGFWGWPSIFLVNLPLVTIAAIVAWRVIPLDCPVAEPFDLVGAGLAGATLFGLLYALSGIEAAPILSTRVLAPAVLAALGGLAFTRVERGAAHPMLDLSLFENRQFLSGAVSALLAFVALSASIFLMPFYLTRVKELDVRLVGLLLAATPVLMATLGPWFGRMSDRIGPRALTTGGMAALSVSLLGLSMATAETPLWSVVLGLVGIGGGLSMFQAPNSSAVLENTPRDRLGIGSAVIGNARSVGMAIGISLTAAVAGAAMANNGGDGAEFTQAMSIALKTGALVALGGALVSWGRGARQAPIPAMPNR